MTLVRTPPDRLQADAARGIALREERAISWLRTVGGLIAIAVIPLMAAPLPDGGGRVAAQVLAAAASVTGIVGLAVLRPQIAARTLLRFRMWTLASDALITLLFTTLFAEQPALGLFMLALPVQGAMKLGAPGALAITVLAAGSGAVSQGLRSAIAGTAWNPDLAWATVLPGLGFGLMVTFLATTRGLETLEILRLASDVEWRRRAGRVVHEAAHDGTVTEDATRALVDAVGARTRVDLAVLVDLREDPVRELTWWLRDGHFRTDSVAVEVDGPIARVAASGRTVYAPPGTPVASRGLIGGQALVAVPVLVGGQPIAALVGETGDPNGIRPACLEDLEQTADQLALIFGLAHVRTQRDTLAREIAELEGARDQVLAIGSHELRTPLTTIVGFSELMATNGAAMAPADVVHFGRAMNRASVRLLRTLEDVQLADNLRRRVLPTALENVELGPLASSVAEAWPGTVVRTGGRTRVTADPGHLQTVIERLLDNAWEHGGGADVEVSWTVLGDRAVLTIADAGPGMPAARREQLTAPFAQAQDVLAHQRGTGLGLTIARGLCEAMHADMVLADGPEPGTRWDVWLPLATAAAEPSQPEGLVNLDWDAPARAAAAPSVERRHGPRRADDTRAAARHTDLH